jgi:5-methyltetrahydropteroyltriglutamate--homocysteine methyltransferase
MSMRDRPPFRADHVGSLLRPPELLQARADLDAGLIDAVELRAVEDEAIRTIVRRQEEVGLTSATDGEFRRSTSRGSSASRRRSSATRSSSSSRA